MQSNTKSDSSPLEKGRVWPWLPGERRYFVTKAMILVAISGFLLSLAVFLIDEASVRPNELCESTLCSWMSAAWVFVFHLPVFPLAGVFVSKGIQRHWSQQAGGGSAPEGPKSVIGGSPDAPAPHKKKSMSWVKILITVLGVSAGSLAALSATVVAVTVAFFQLVGWFVHALPEIPPKGRVLRLRGRTRMAKLQASTHPTWASPIKLSVLPLAQARPHLMALWQDAARMEHASVPAFGRLSEELMAFGAPPELIAGSHRAALQEIEHAKDCLGVARALGSDADFAAFPEVRLRGPGKPPSLERLALGNLRDGVVGEGVAARVADIASKQVTDPTVKAIVAKIAVEERSHAELSWQVLSFCMQQDPSRIGPYLKDRASDLERYVLAVRPKLEVSDQVAREWGIVDNAQLGEAIRLELEEIESRLLTLLNSFNQSHNPSLPHRLAS